MNIATSTVSSQYQTTLPKKARELLGIKANDKVEFRLDRHSNRLYIKKAASIDELADRWTKNIKPGLEPLQNVDEFYQKRTARL